MLDKVSDHTLAVGEDEIVPDIFIGPRFAIEDTPKRHWFVTLLVAVLQAGLMVLLLVAAFFVTQRMIAEKPEPRKRPAFKTVYTVETVDAVQKNHQPIFVAYGQTTAARSVELRSLVSGEVIKVNDGLRPGARVSKGEPLVEIDPFSYRGAISEAEANLAEANAKISENEAQTALEGSKLEAAQEQLEFAAADLTRAERLRQRGTSTQQQLEARKLVVSQRKQAVALSRDMIAVQNSRVGQLKASVDRLKWRLDEAKRNLSSTILKAPFAGIVRSSNAEVGRAITANDVVVSLYEADTLEVKFTLTDAQYGRLQATESGLVGRDVEVTWNVGAKAYPYLATIVRIGAEITSARGGVEVIARVKETNNAVTIRPGAFVEVRVPDKVFKGTTAIPDTALYGTNTVYTEVEGVLVENKVTIAAFEGEHVLVSDGLKAGDKVLITRITEVSAGLRVRREGDAAPRRGTAGGTNVQPASATRTGRPSQEEIASILKSSNMTQETFSALSREERRALIQAHRAKNQ